MFGAILRKLVVVISSLLVMSSICAASTFEQQLQSFLEDKPKLMRIAEQLSEQFRLDPQRRELLKLNAYGMISNEQVMAPLLRKVARQGLEIRHFDGRKATLLAQEYVENLATRGLPSLSVQDLSTYFLFLYRLQRNMPPQACARFADGQYKAVSSEVVRQATEKTYQQMTLEEMKRTLSVNTRAVFRGVNAKPLRLTPRERRVGQEETEVMISDAIERSSPEMAERLAKIFSIFDHASPAEKCWVNSWMTLVLSTARGQRGKLALLYLLEQAQ